MFRCAGLALILLTTSAAWGSEIPRYDIEATCRAAPTLQGGPGNTDRNCIRDETQARTQLGQQWAGFDARQPGRMRPGGGPWRVAELRRPADVPADVSRRRGTTGCWESSFGSLDEHRGCGY